MLHRTTPWPPQAASRFMPALGLGLTVAVLAIVTTIRLIGLKYSTVDLFFDESQYWAWSRELAFGYFSKPPLLAWVIAAAEQVCGSSEACIRAPAPILYFGTALLVYAVARRLYDRQVACLAALSIGLATGTAFSARIISTDVPLLFFWTLALLAYVKLVTGGSARWSIVLGLAFGLGLMAKYAMIYFVLGVALAAWLDPDARKLLRTPGPWLALLIAAAIATPNIVWNLDNGLATFRHTGDNIQGGGAVFDARKGFEFILAQFAVVGPVLFAVLLVAFVRIASPTLTRADRLLLAFAIPPLALVIGVGFITRALANWAAPAFISATILAIALLVRWRAWKWIALSLSLGLIPQVALLIGDPLATRIHLPWPAKGDVYNRTLGWRELGETAGRLARQEGARTITGDLREDVASMVYYWRDQPEQVLAWQRGPVPDHQFELTRALTDASPEPILFITRCGTAARLSPYFANVKYVGPFYVATGPTSLRQFLAFRLEGRKRSLGPVGGC